MNYELAKKLKDAGFPQINKGGIFGGTGVCQRVGCNNPVFKDGLMTWGNGNICASCDEYWYKMGSRRHAPDCICAKDEKGEVINYMGQCRSAKMEMKQEDERVYYPTLSELIEACEAGKGDEFYLRICHIWEAGYVYHGYFEGWPAIKREENGYVDVDIKTEGSSPEEAVANLWLELNKK